MTTIIYDAFVHEGGYSEHLAAARLAERDRQKRHRTDPTDRSDLSAPTCPACGQPMRLRTARQGAHAGSRFWGCAGFPTCKATRPLDRA